MKVRSLLRSSIQGWEYGAFSIFLLLGLSALMWYVSLKGIVEALLGAEEISWDFQAYHWQSRTLMEGGNLYIPYYAVFPPITYSLLFPFALFNLETSWILFSAFNIALLALSIFLSMKILEAHLFRPLTIFEKAVIVAVFLCFGPARTTVEWGQTNYFLLAFLLMAWYAIKKGRPMLAGILLTVAIISKPIPVLLLAYFVWKGEKRATAGILATSSILALTSVLAFGWDIHTEYWRMLSTLLFTMWEPTNVSPYRYVQNAFPELAWILLPALGALILASTVFVTRGRVQPARFFDFEFSTIIVSSLIFSPYLHFHHWMWIIPAFLPFIFVERDWWTLALLGFAYAFLSIGWRHSTLIVILLWLFFMRKCLQLRNFWAVE